MLKFPYGETVATSCARRVVSHNNARAGAADHLRDGPRSRAFSGASFEDVVKAVESVKGEPWRDFANRQGDWGRDMALYAGRLRCGLTLKELGAYAGMNTPAVCQSVLRVKRRLENDEALKKEFTGVLSLLNETD